MVKKAAGMGKRCGFSENCKKHNHGQKSTFFLKSAEQAHIFLESAGNNAILTTVLFWKALTKTTNMIKSVYFLKSAEETKQIFNFLKSAAEEGTSYSNKFFQKIRRRKHKKNIISWKAQKKETNVLKHNCAFLEKPKPSHPSVKKSRPSV